MRVLLYISDFQRLHFCFNGVNPIFRATVAEIQNILEYIVELV